MAKKRLFKKREGDKIWWVDTDRIGEYWFTFDKKKYYNLFHDYPFNLTKEERELFDKENPFWVKRLGDRKKHTENDSDGKTTFCDKWIKVIEAEDERTFEKQFGEECSEALFKMDGFESFRELYPDIKPESGRAEELKEIIDEIEDISLLGSMVYSQWRYLTHWNMGYSLAEYKEWFIQVLRRMKEILEKG